MLTKRYTCIICPSGCDIVAQIDGKELISAEGARCKKGTEYVCGELSNPVRNIASSVLVDGGEMPLASVRLSAPIPKNAIFDVMDQIKTVRIQAPVKQGQIVIENILGLGCDLIATRQVMKI